MEHLLNHGILEIVGTTLRMSFFSTLLAGALGVLLGFALEWCAFPGKRVCVRILHTLMGLPPVVAGLAVFLLLMRSGPLGGLELLFTVRAMVLAQILILVPIVASMVHTSATEKAPRIRAFAITMGADRRQVFRTLLHEMRRDCTLAVLTGFGRSISEVGAIMIVGGNLEHKTRTMTTAISLLRNRGEYRQAIVLGALLLGIAFLIQWSVDCLCREEEPNENY